MKHIGLFLMLVFLTVQADLYGQRSITGTVTDSETNDPLIGANILITGTSKGTVTDFDGNFELEVSETDKMLQFSYIGYQTIDVNIEGKSNLIISLDPSRTLSEVIVIGYGTQKKSDKTGAVASVDEDELLKGRLSDPIQALQGKAAGVTISKQGGDPNSGFSVNIRGAVGLTTKTGPLFVVDGVPGVDPTTINPDDIASFNVLKDASSAAIYGSRGANGVVIITTKGSGLKGGQVKENHFIEYNGFVAMDDVANRLDFLDADQIKNFAAETGATFTDNGGNVDWQDEIFRSGITQSHTLAFSGNSQNSSYRASLSANDILGVIEGSGKKRYIGRLNLTQKTLNDRVTLNARLSGTIEQNDYINYGDGISPSNVLYQTFRRSPVDPVRNADGSFFETDKSFQYFNPVAIIEDIQNNRSAKRYLANFRADVDIYRGLSGSINMAYIRDDEEKFYFEPSFTPSNENNGFGKREYNNQESVILESLLKYNNSFSDVHNLNLMGGYSYQIDTKDGFSAEGKNAQSDFVTSNNLEVLLQLDPGSIKSYKNEALLISFFGRAVYDFDKKYFLTATMRRDGSSKFGANNEWGWFPSASFGWDLTRESFLEDMGNLSRLKFRAGYGITGNQELDPNLDARFFQPAGTAIDPETGNVVISFENANDVNPNPDLKWEENKELNVGFDFGFWNDRISGSLEFYNKITSDLIWKYELPVPPNRNRYIYANAGEIENNGLEATIQAFVLDRPNLDWKSILTFSTNSQKTNKLSNDLYDLDEIKTLFVEGRGLVGGENWTQIVRPGDEIGTFFMPEYAGLSDDGKFLFYTAAGGVTRDVTKAERRVVGSAQPDFTLGWSNYFEFGNGFDAGIALRSVIGFDVLNVTKMVFSNPSDLPTLNVLQEGLDEYDRGLTSSPTPSSYYLEDGTFLKVDNVSLGYTFNKSQIKKLQSLRMYLSATNLYTLTGYSGTDPELSYGELEFGRDQYDVYPKTRSITFGINATF